jgi:hypothetical protein
VTPLAKVLQALGDRVVRKSGAEHHCRCPGHDDKRASLGVRARDDGGVLLKCQAGCEANHILDKLNLRWSDLRIERQERDRILKTYPYRDERGTLLYEAVRMDPKDFRQRRPRGNGWDWTMGDVRRVLYHLPELLAAAPRVVWIPEGERDVETLESWGLVATTNAGGAGKWRAEYGESLRGRKVIILPDNDEPGRKHAEQVATMLTGIASSIQTITLPGLPPKGDVSWWAANGGTREALLALASAKAPPPPTSDREAEIRRRLSEIAAAITGLHEYVNGSTAPQLRVVQGGRVS